MSKKTIDAVAQAKKTLESHGYFVHNLWHIDDVFSRYECDEDVAQDILNSALTNEGTMEHIWYDIDVAIEEEKSNP